MICIPKVLDLMLAQMTEGSLSFSVILVHTKIVLYFKIGHGHISILSIPSYVVILLSLLRLETSTVNTASLNNPPANQLLNVDPFLYHLNSCCQSS
jgi:hypothetical protein